MGDSSNQQLQGHTRIPDRNTLLVYWYLCSYYQEGCGARSVQRAMGFSSPSSAVFHLERLVEMNLAQKARDGQYHILQRRKFGLMKRFFCLGSWWIPKHLVYAIATTTSILVVLLLLFPVIVWLVVIALLPAALSVVILWYEAIILLRRRPIFQKDATR